jgi:hypothetical protein
LAFPAAATNKWSGLLFRRLFMVLLKPPPPQELFEMDAYGNT